LLLAKGEGQPFPPTVNFPSLEIEERLQKVQVRINQVKAINSSAVSVSWMVRVVLNNLITS